MPKLSADQQALMAVQRSLLGTEVQWEKKFIGSRSARTNPAVVRERKLNILSRRMVAVVTTLSDICEESPKNMFTKKLLMSHANTSLENENITRN